MNEGRFRAREIWYGKIQKNHKFLHKFFKYFGISICKDHSQKAGNARWNLLAYQKFACIEAMQNGKVDFAQFPMV